MAEAVVRNDGTLSSPNYAIHNLNYGAPLYVSNNGTGQILGDIHSLSRADLEEGAIPAPASDDLVADIVINSGLIEGDVHLGLGADNYFGGGTLQGSISGGEGNDTLTLADGNTRIHGGSGENTLTGGLGQDQFVVDPAESGVDTITDFEVYKDSIDVTAFAFKGQLQIGTITANDGLLDAEITEIGSTLEVDFDFDDDGEVDHKVILSGLDKEDIADVAGSFTYADPNFVGSLAELTNLPDSARVGLLSADIQDSADILLGLILGVINPDNAPGVEYVSQLTVVNDFLIIDAADLASYPIPVRAEPDQFGQAGVLANTDLFVLESTTPDVLLGNSFGQYGTAPSAFVTINDLQVTKIGAAQGGTGTLATDGAFVLLISDTVQSIEQADFTTPSNLNRPEVVKTNVQDTAAALYAAQQAGKFQDPDNNLSQFDRIILRDTADNIFNAAVAGQTIDNLDQMTITQDTLWVPFDQAGLLPEVVLVEEGATLRLQGHPDELASLNTNTWVGDVEFIAEVSAFEAESINPNDFDEVILVDAPSVIADLVIQNSQGNRSVALDNVGALESEGFVVIPLAALEAFDLPIFAQDDFSYPLNPINYPVFALGSVQELSAGTFEGPAFVDSLPMVFDSVAAINGADFFTSALAGSVVLVSDTLAAINGGIDDPGVPDQLLYYNTVSDSVENIFQAEQAGEFVPESGFNAAEAEQIVAVGSGTEISAAFDNGSLPTVHTKLVIDEGGIFLPAQFFNDASFLAPLFDRPFEAVENGSILVEGSAQSYADGFDEALLVNLEGNYSLAIKDSADAIINAFLAEAVPDIINEFKVDSGSLYLPLDLVTGQYYYTGVEDGAVFVTGTVEQVNAANLDMFAGEWRLDVVDTIDAINDADFGAGNIAGAGYISVSDQSSAINDYVALNTTVTYINELEVTYQHYLEAGVVAKPVVGVTNAFTAEAGISSSVEGFVEGFHFLNFPELVSSGIYDTENLVFEGTPNTGANVINTSFDNGDTTVTLYLNDGDDVADASITLLGQDLSNGEINGYDFWGLQAGEEEPLPAGQLNFNDWLAASADDYPDGVVLKDEAGVVTEVILDFPLLAFYIEDGAEREAFLAARPAITGLISTEDYYTDVLTLSDVDLPLSAEGGYFDAELGIYVDNAVYVTDSVLAMQSADISTAAFAEAIFQVYGNFDEVVSANFAVGGLSRALSEGDIFLVDTAATIRDGSLDTNPLLAEEDIIFEVDDNLAGLLAAEADFAPGSGTRLETSAFVRLTDAANILYPQLAAATLPDYVDALGIDSGDLLLSPFEFVANTRPISIYFGANLSVQGSVQSYVDAGFEQLADPGLVRGDYNTIVVDSAQNLQDAFFAGSIASSANVIAVTEGTLQLPLDFDSFLDGRVFYTGLGEPGVDDVWGEISVYGSVENVNLAALYLLGDNARVDVNDTLANIQAAQFSDQTLNISQADYVVVVDDASVIAEAVANDLASLPLNVGGIDVGYHHVAADGDTARAVHPSSNTFEVRNDITLTIEGFVDTIDHFEIPDVTWDNPAWDGTNFEFGPNVPDDGLSQIDVYNDEANNRTIIDIFADDDSELDSRIVLADQLIADQIDEYDFWGLSDGVEPIDLSNTYTLDELIDADPSQLALEGVVKLRDELWVIENIVNGVWGDDNLQYVTEYVVINPGQSAPFSMSALEALNAPISVEGIGYNENAGFYTDNQVVGTGSIEEAEQLDLSQPGLAGVIILPSGTVAEFNAADYSTPGMAAAKGSFALVVVDTAANMNAAESILSGNSDINASNLVFWLVQDSVAGLRADEAEFASERLQGLTVEVADTAQNLTDAFLSEAGLPARAQQVSVTEGVLNLPVGLAVSSAALPTTVQDGAHLVIGGSVQDFLAVDFDNSFDWELFQGSVEIIQSDTADNLFNAYFAGQLSYLAGTIEVNEGDLYLPLDVDSFLDGRYNYATAGDGHLSFNGTVAEIEAAYLDTITEGTSWTLSASDRVDVVHSTDWSVGNLSAVEHITVFDTASSIASYLDAVGPQPLSYNDTDVVYHHILEDGGTAYPVGGTGNTFAASTNVAATVDGFVDGIHLLEFSDLVWAPGFDASTDVSFGANVTDDGIAQIDITFDGAETTVNLYQDDDANIDASITLAGGDYTGQLDAFDFSGLRAGEYQAPDDDSISLDDWFNSSSGGDPVTVRGDAETLYNIIFGFTDPTPYAPIGEYIVEQNSNFPIFGTALEGTDFTISVDGLHYDPFADVYTPAVPWVIGKVGELTDLDTDTARFDNAVWVVIDTVDAINGANYDAGLMQEARDSGLLIVEDTASAIHNATLVAALEEDDVIFNRVIDTLLSIEGATLLGYFDEGGGSRLADVFEVALADSADNIAGGFLSIPDVVSEIIVTEGVLDIPVFLAVGDAYPVETSGSGYVRILGGLDDYEASDFENSFNRELYSGGLEIVANDTAERIEQDLYSGEWPAFINTFEVNEGRLHLPLDQYDFLDGSQWFFGLGDPDADANPGEIYPWGSISSLEQANLYVLDGYWTLEANDTYAAISGADFTDPDSNLSSVGFIWVSDGAGALAALADSEGPLPTSFDGIDAFYHHYGSDGVTAKAVLGTGNAFEAGDGVTMGIEDFTDGVDRLTIPDATWNNPNFNGSNYVIGPNEIGDGSINIHAYDDVEQNITVVDVYSDDFDDEVDTQFILLDRQIASDINEFDINGLRGGEQEPLNLDNAYTFGELAFADPFALGQLDSVVLRDEDWVIQEVLAGNWVHPNLDFVTELRVIDPGGNFNTTVEVLNNLDIPISVEGMAYYPESESYFDNFVAAVGSVAEVAAVDLTAPAFVDALLIPAGSVEEYALADFNTPGLSQARLTNSLLVFDAASNMNNADDILSSANASISAADLNFWIVQDTIAGLEFDVGQDQFSTDRVSGLRVEVTEDADTIEAAGGLAGMPAIATGIAVTSGTLNLTVADVLASDLTVNTWEGYVQIEGSLAEYIDSSFATNFKAENWFGSYEVVAEDTASNYYHVFGQGTFPDGLNTARVTEGDLLLPLDNYPFLDGSIFWDGLGVRDGVDPWGEVIPYGSVASINAADFNAIGGNYHYNVHDTWANVRDADFGDIGQNISGANLIIVTDDSTVIATAIDDEGPLPNSLNGIKVDYHHIGVHDSLAKAVPGAMNTFGIAYNDVIRIEGYTDAIDEFEFYHLTWANPDQNFDPSLVSFSYNDDLPPVDGADHVHVFNDVEAGSTVIDLYRANTDGIPDSRIVLTDQQIAEDINAYDIWGLHQGTEPVDLTGSYTYDELINTDIGELSGSVTLRDDQDTIGLIVLGERDHPNLALVDQYVVDMEGDFYMQASQLAGFGTPIIVEGVYFDLASSQYVESKVVAYGSIADIELIDPTEPVFVDAVLAPEDSVQAFADNDFSSAGMIAARDSGVLAVRDTAANIHDAATILSTAGALITEADLVFNWVQDDLPNLNGAIAAGYLDGSVASNLNDVSIVEWADSPQEILADFDNIPAEVTQIAVTDGNLDLTVDMALGTFPRISTWDGVSVSVSGSLDEYVGTDFINTFNPLQFWTIPVIRLVDVAPVVNQLYASGGIPAEINEVVITDGQLDVFIDGPFAPVQSLATEGFGLIHLYGDPSGIANYDFNLVSGNWTLFANIDLAGLDGLDFTLNNLDRADIVVVSDDAALIAAETDLPATIAATGAEVWYAHEISSDLTVSSVNFVSNELFEISDGVTATIQGFDLSQDNIGFPDQYASLGIDPSNYIFSDYDGTDGLVNIAFREDQFDTIVEVFVDEDPVADISVTLEGLLIAEQLEPIVFAGMLNVPVDDGSQTPADMSTLTLAEINALDDQAADYPSAVTLNDGFATVADAIFGGLAGPNENLISAIESTGGNLIVNRAALDALDPSITVDALGSSNGFDHVVLVRGTVAELTADFVGAQFGDAVPLIADRSAPINAIIPGTSQNLDFALANPAGLVQVQGNAAAILSDSLLNPVPWAIDSGLNAAGALVVVSDPGEEINNQFANNLDLYGQVGAYNVIGGTLVLGAAVVNAGTYVGGIPNTDAFLKVFAEPGDLATYLIPPLNIDYQVLLQGTENADILNGPLEAISEIDRGYTINGLGGNDTLIVGPGGDNYLVGGEGSDIFTIIKQGGNSATRVTIADFETGDQIHLDRAGHWGSEFPLLYDVGAQADHTAFMFAVHQLATGITIGAETAESKATGTLGPSGWVGYSQYAVLGMAGSELKVALINNRYYWPTDTQSRVTGVSLTEIQPWTIAVVNGSAVPSVGDIQLI